MLASTHLDNFLLHTNVRVYMGRVYHWLESAPSYWNLRRLLFLQKTMGCPKKDIRRILMLRVGKFQRYSAGTILLVSRRESFMVQGTARALQEGSGAWSGIHWIWLVYMLSQTGTFRTHSCLPLVLRVWKNETESHPCGLLSKLKVIQEKSQFN